jgi:hypothetical protein
MGYGLAAYNGSSRVQIDSDTPYPILYQNFSATYTSGTVYANANNDLVFVRPTNNNAVLNKAYSGGITTSGAVNFDLKAYKSTLDGAFTPSTTGYGLNIFNASGGCIFSATAGQFSSNMDIVLLGQVNTPGGTVLYQDFPMPSATYALSTGKIFVTLNSFYNGASSESIYIQCYVEYLSGTGTYGTIRVWSQVTQPGPGPGGGLPVTRGYNSGNWFAVGYYRG